MARGDPRDRTLRGGLVAQDLDLPDPDEHGEEAGRPRAACCAVLGAGLPGRGRRGVVDADRFLPAGHLWAGHWAAGPTSWGPAPEERLLAAEAREAIETAIETLPESQRQVITLRDVEGWSAEEVCDALEITEVNQRVLLHRARAKVRASLAEYLNGPDAI